ncbi:MAG: DUF2141 domain-containing protein [Bacteroidales bacterium]
MSSRNIEVTVTGIRSEKGQIAIGVFADDESFQQDRAVFEIQFPKKELIKGSMTVSFSLEPGTWGLALLDDENRNLLMEYNFPGIPKEGLGFSGYYHSGLSKPSFDMFRFELAKDQSKRIKIKVRYIL